MACATRWTRRTAAKRPRVNELEREPLTAAGPSNRDVPRPSCSTFRGVIAALLLAAASNLSLASPSRAQIVPAVGLASYYGSYHQGLRTASGETFDMRSMTAAHRTLPFGTQVRVTNLANGRAVVVRITDRGPFVRGRMLDVSYAAARRLGLVRCGTAQVSMEVI